MSEPDENTLRSIGIDGLIELVGVLRRDHRLIVAERDRLRAVVRSLRTGLEMVEAVTDIDVAHGYARAALDGTGNMGGASWPPPRDELPGDEHLAEASALAQRVADEFAAGGPSLNEWEQAIADVTRAAMRAHTAGVPVSLHYETGQWTIGPDKSSAGGVVSGRGDWDPLFASSREPDAIQEGDDHG